MEHIHLQIQSLEQRTRRLERWLRCSISLWLLTCGVIVISAWAWPAQTQQSSVTSTLRASELSDRRSERSGARAHRRGFA